MYQFTLSRVLILPDHQGTEATRTMDLSYRFSCRII